MYLSSVLHDIGIEHNIIYTENFTNRRKIMAKFVFSNNIDNILRFTKLNIRFCKRKQEKFNIVHQYYFSRKRKLIKLQKYFNFTKSHPEISISTIAKKYKLSWSTVSNWRKERCNSVQISNKDLVCFHDYLQDSSIKNPLNGETLSETIPC